ncbi:MAG: YkgJ family cysteine cluster protein [Myxococcales bacterium]|nr:YkgJ family cysteine cluster protein [Myxococcales bacterium]
MLPAMSKNKSDKTFRILNEVERTLPDRTDLPPGVAENDVENPYWLWDELPPHPNPEKGCIQRGLCCRSSPGRFAPGEVEKAAELLGKTPDAFVKRYLVVDKVKVDGEEVAVFAPVKLDRKGKPALPTGGPVDRLYQVLRGTCVFFDGTTCKIYGARPWECREYICTKPPEENPSHADVGRKWLEQ